MKRSPSRAGLVAMALMALVAATNVSGGEESFESRSLVELIARPEFFNGKRVHVEGYIVLEFESRAVYLTEDSARYFIFKNGLWLDFDKSVDPTILRSAVNGSYAVVEGTFDMTATGHMGAYAGGLTNVTRIQPLRTRQSQAPSSSKSAE